MPDLVGRKFTADRPNELYVGDITYLPCKGGKNMCLATVIDAYSRKLVGHALADHMRVSLVIEALPNARKARASLAGAIFHSDHGSVYTSQAFRGHCAQLGVRQSMGAVGTSADNALAEFLIGSEDALILAHISWRCANHLSYGVTLHVLGHVV